MSVDNIANMPFVIKGNKKEGYKLWNKDKKTYAKKTFDTKEKAEKMKAVYDNFAYGRKKPKEEKED
jgi:heme/copper-type cytochrome/quinol oxidase subunit 2